LSKRLELVIWEIELLHAAVLSFRNQALFEELVDRVGNVERVPHRFAPQEGLQVYRNFIDINGVANDVLGIEGCGMQFQRLDALDGFEVCVVARTGVVFHL